MRDKQKQIMALFLLGTVQSYGNFDDQMRNKHIYANYITRRYLLETKIVWQCWHTNAWQPDANHMALLYVFGSNNMHLARNMRREWSYGHVIVQNKYFMLTY